MSQLLKIFPYPCSKTLVRSTRQSAELQDYMEIFPEKTLEFSQPAQIYLHDLSPELLSPTLQILLPFS